MPHLSWSLPPSDLDVQFQSTPRGERTSVRLRIDASQAAELAQSVIELKDHQELRNTLTGSWTIFWKLREGESRLLVAHPESDRWVATFSLTAEDRDRVVTWLRKGAEFRLGEALSLGWQSNLDWTWVLE